MRDVRNTIVGAILVFAAYYLGLFIVNVSELPIPGPLMGLFLLLATLFLFPQLEVHTASNPNLKEVLRTSHNNKGP